MLKMQKPEYLKNVMRLPWRGKWTPHAVLDISRRCNISCRACYNNNDPRFKEIEEIKEELKILLQHRRLQTVLIVGGEPLLHPKLSEIIKMVKSYNLIVEICTNGVLLDDETAKKLSESGVSIVSLHIEEAQKRPDLPYESTVEQRNALREEKAKLCLKYNIEPAVMITIFKDNQKAINECIEYVLNSEIVHYCTMTSFINGESIGVVQCDSSGRLYAKDASKYDNSLGFQMEELAQIAGKYFDNTPFGYIGTNRNKNNPRWLMYHTICAGKERVALNASLSDTLFMFFHKLLKGQGVFCVSQCPVLTKLRLISRLLHGNFKGLGFLLKNKDKRFVQKVIMFTTEAEIREDGEIELCESCIDVQVKNGKLVPTCLIDNIVE